MAEALRIPPGGGDELKRLAAMDADQYERLTRLVSALPTNGLVTATPFKTVEDLPVEDREPFLSIIGLIGYLGRAASRLKVPRDEVLTQVLDQTPDLDPGFADSFAKRFTKLFSNKSISLHARAWDLLYEDQRQATGFRIVTDVRPIFDESGTIPEGYILVNHLHVSYSENNRSHNIFFDLDEDDIEKLETVAQRAKDKIASIKARRAFMI